MSPSDDERSWRRVKEVLQLALEHTPAERGPFLERACEGQPALRTEVEALLAAHEAAGQFAERSPLDELADAADVMQDGDRTDWLFEPGDHLGPYQIEQCLGTGGMGQVYKAIDTRLDRAVAVKILSRGMHLQADLRSRFDREARAVAALRHPHICMLLDVGHDAGVEFLVMEYLDGESLAARLKRGPLPLDEVLRYAMEIADALAETHRHGIVHRDLKPGNVMITSAGAKLLDYGMAKRQPQVTADAGTSSARNGSLTGSAAIVGTLHYMAPEQLEGRETDERSDIFAFGAVLYELITGSKAFDGGSQARVVAAILECEPAPIEDTVPFVNPRFERLIHKCLRKDPRERWQRSDDVLGELRQIGALGMPSAAHATRTRRQRRTWVVMSVAVVALVALAFWRTDFGRNSLADPSAGSRVEVANTVTVAPPLVVGRLHQLTADEGLQLDPAFSPDGKFVAYSGGDENQLRIFIRSSAGGHPIRLTDAPAAIEYQPRWSPDGNSILYVTGQGAFVATAFGGMERRLDSATDSVGAYSTKLGVGVRVTGAAWSPDGRHIALAYGGALWVAPAEGGGEHRLLARAADELRQCDWSPDNRWIACASGNWTFAGSAGNIGNIAPSAIVLVPADGGNVIEITDRGAQNESPAWSRDGSLLYFVSNREGTSDVYAVGLAANGQTVGMPVRVTTGLGAHSIAFSAEGTRLSYSAYIARANIWSLAIPSRGPVDISAAQPVTSGNQVVEAMNVSRDGKWLLFDSTQSGNADIFRIPLAGGRVERLTTHPAPDFAPDASPDGRFLAYHSWRTGTRDVFVQPFDGGPATPVTNTPQQESFPFWSADGQSLTFYEQTVENGVARGSFVVTRRENGSWSPPVPLDVPAGAAAHILSEHRVLSWLPNLIQFSGPGVGRRILYQASPASADPPVDQVQTSEDGRNVYFKSHDPQGRAMFWSLPISGGRPRLLVRFDDPTRPSTRQDFAVGGGRFYFAVNSRLSNIWIADVAKR